MSYKGKGKEKVKGKTTDLQGDPLEWSEWSEWQFNNKWGCWERSRDTGFGLEFEYSESTGSESCQSQYSATTSHLSPSLSTIRGGATDSVFDLAKTMSSANIGNQASPSLPHSYNNATYDSNHYMDDSESGQRLAPANIRPENQSPELQMIREPDKFFKIGCVFMTMWLEPAGDTADDESAFITTTPFEGKGFAKVKRFVVVRKMHGCAWCLAMFTHNGRGATKSGARASDYAAVYDAASKPQLLPWEQLTKAAIPIVVETPGERIDSMSRLNFGRIYTVEHNLKVRKIGRVHQDSLSVLELYFASTAGFTPETVFSEQSEGDRNQQEEQIQRSETLSNDSYRPPFARIMLSDPYPNVRNTQESTLSTSIPSSVQRIIRKSDSGDAEKIDPRFRAVPIKSWDSFWKVGRVFKMLWTEPAGSNRSQGSQSSHLSQVIYGESAASFIRRFVVIKRNWGSCICLGVFTYGRQATLKPNLPDPTNHAIIHTVNEAPPPLQGEVLNFDPIRVVLEQNDSDGHLHLASRINFTKVYTVEMNVGLVNIGMIHPSSMSALAAASPLKFDPVAEPVAFLKKHNKKKRKATKSEKGVSETT